MKKTHKIQRDKEYTIEEAYRYLENAKQTLSKSPVEYGLYTDSKYIREAAGIAYLSALKAIDTYLLYKGIDRDKLPKSIDGYWDLMRKKIPVNGKLKSALTIAWENLHVFAYYRGAKDVKLLKSGFENCKKIIQMLEKAMKKTKNI
jgi:hypothetical protein